MALTFSGASLDRAAHLRSLDRLPARAHTMLVGPEQTVLLDSAGVLARRPLTGPAEDERVFLGLEDQSALFALDCAASAELAFTPLRAAAAALSPEDAAIAGYAVALVGWHRLQRHCGRCGALTHSELAGHRRGCPVCGQRYFPRTDPVITMVVDAGERCLLTRRRGAARGTWSALAGFVEPGETPEEAVVREAREEVGIDVLGVRYVAAQPWPFPHALMLGFRAYADPDGAQATMHDAEELLDARWFTRAQLSAGLQAGQIRLPPPIAIGHRLIVDWLRGA